ncbi:hypothetical protein [Bacteriovorax sp. Seq25_V]|uniref:hypothetical protein n=1 Tax=Bacteriovorax sp. Seq25_V TaxID=1201288 RepID=UPI00038A3CED|nr:hypothetical protein [Bacteriovorax sp. Seq25_V]EQC45317.1 hypothetical protein M900_2107 [Bacteriovorax sp. Seq25_V]
MLTKINNRLSSFYPLFGFYFLAWVVHLIIISIISFFHFRLDHRLIVIENWIFDYAWTLSLMSKVIAFILYWRYFYEDRIKNFTEAFESSAKKSINPEVLIFTIMNFALLSFFVKPIVQENVLFSAGPSITHYLSVFFVFFIDLMVLKIFRRNKGELNIKEVVICSSFLYLYNIAVFPFGENLGISFYSLIVLFFIYYFEFGKSYVNSSIYVLLVLCPLFVILGIDPVWGSKFAYFEPATSIRRDVVFAVLPIVTYVYFSFIRRRTL